MIQNKNTKAKTLSLQDAVKCFLEIVIKEPYKQPKTQREERENRREIIGYNKAQETFRQILEQSRKKDLSEVRKKGQEKPMIFGDGKTRLWIM